MGNWGRKFILTAFLLLGGVGFGMYCVHKGQDLMAAGIYWGAVTTGAFAYHYSNVTQKVKLKQAENGKDVS